MIRTYQYRLKDGNHLKWLSSRARSVDMVWDWCNNAQKHALRHNQKWPRAFDLSNLAAGSSKELKLHSQTVQSITERYVQSRSERNRPYLRYRGKDSLGWIPFKASGIKLAADAVTYCGRRLRFWQDRPIPDNAKITVGSFGQDAVGHWFVNITMKLPRVEIVAANGEIGLDLGQKDMAVGSNGLRIDGSRYYRDMEPRLAKAQRGRKIRQVQRLHRKIAHRRKDANHKSSTDIARSYGLIVVGNVSAVDIAKTPRLAKGALDQGWSDFRNMLRYKAIGRAGIFIEVNEAYTTQTCSICDARTGPRGLAGLKVREWACSNCGTIHDRDINSANNILRLGHETLSRGNPSL